MKDSQARAKASFSASLFIFTNKTVYVSQLAQKLAEAGEGSGDEGRQALCK